LNYKFFFLIVLYFLFFTGCNNDDNDNVVPEIVIRDRAEQQIADNDSILKFLRSHYYNKSKFDNNTDPKISDLQIVEVTSSDDISESADSLLINAVESKTVTFRSTEHILYTLKLNTGGGTSYTNFSDRVRILYEGMLLNKTVFDNSVTPSDFDLVSTDGNRGDIPLNGWQKVLIDFKPAFSFIEENDGTVTYMNHGSGVMFLPSGLSYFASSTAEIPAYSPLIFKFDLLQTIETDYDSDGVPSHLEKFVTTGEYSDQFTVFEDENELDDDTDGDGTPDFIDVDDDGDGILTINEDLNDDGDPTNDIGPNGIPRYLDPEATESKI
jgi:FKBP-type peptidyl-prolyl cis-trans isomerase